MPFYDNTRECKSSEYSFHFFRTVIRVSCTDLSGAKENNEYQRTAEIFIALEKFWPSLKYFIRTRTGATWQVNIVTEFGGVD